MNLINNLLADLLAQPGFSPMMLAIGMAMYAGWTLAYILIIKTCFRQKTYGVPMVCICLDVVWEFMFSFQVVTDLHWFFVWGNRFWFGLDLLIFWQLFRYGREEQIYPLLREHFQLVLWATFVLCAIGLYTFTIYFNDRKGVASSFSINLLISVLYIFMLFNRPDLRGLPYSVAWLKMIGTAVSSLFIFKWWPAQFPDGRLIGHPEITAPQSYGYMIFLYVAIFLVDCLYIYLLGQRRRELKAQAAFAGAAAPAVAVAAVS